MDVNQFGLAKLTVLSRMNPVIAAGQETVMFLPTTLVVNTAAVELLVSGIPAAVAAPSAATSSAFMVPSRN